MKLAQSIKPDLIPRPQLFNKGSQTQTRKIPSTHESERLKSVFLDAITHDLRTPLTAIKASVTSLLDGLGTDFEQRKELLTIIDEECDRINRLVSEALEIARLESGEMKLNEWFRRAPRQSFSLSAGPVSSTVRGGVPFSPSACQQNATGIRNTSSGTCARELKRTPGRDSKTTLAIHDEVKRASSASHQWLEAYSPNSANSQK